VAIVDKAYINDDYIERADRQYIYLIIQNRDVISSVENIKVHLSTSDERVEEIIANNINLGSIAAGVSDTSDNTYSFDYAEGYNPDSTINNTIHFDVKIYSNGNHYWSDSFEFNADLTPPDVPTNLNALINVNSIILSWSPCEAEDLHSYNIYRSAHNDTTLAEYLNSLESDVNVFTDSTLLDSGTYYYWITALDLMGNESIFSEVDSVHFTIVGIKDNLESIPSEFALFQNHPNPFNPTTIINYQIPMTSNVELSIYNLLGQKVATLVNKKQQAGSYQVEWDASNFSTGVYLYRLSAEEFTATRKLILMK